MNIKIKESKNSTGTLTIHNGADVKFAHYNTNTGKVSILNNPIAKQIVKLNGEDHLKKAIAERVEIWKFETSPLRKLSKEKVQHMTEILASMAILTSALDNASNDLSETCKGIDMSLIDVSNLRETSATFMKNTAKSLGIDLAIDAFDYGEDIYTRSIAMAKKMELLKQTK